MDISITELFKIGIGPSSSHTVGPMKAAAAFISSLEKNSKFENLSSICIELYGSLALTGRGHGTDKAILLGLESYEPATVASEIVSHRMSQVQKDKRLHLIHGKVIDFDPTTQLIFKYDQVLPLHSNGVKFIASLKDGTEFEEVYYSVGGGFITDAEGGPVGDSSTECAQKSPYPFSNGANLLELCGEHGLCISTLMLENETKWRSKEETKKYLLEVWNVMESCIDRGCETEGTLPGGLKVKRRAPALGRKLNAMGPEAGVTALNYVNLYALAVSEENASGGQVVTAPTNGAAGIMPAVLSYFKRTRGSLSEDQIVRFLLTAGAIGILCKKNASISGAEVGCQGEVGVACAMAAGGLVEIMGGSPEQVENAAEVGIEHNLGLTCDPIKGLVQIPCIERNAMGAVKAINAAQLAIFENGLHVVSLDKALETMMQTGADMQAKYKETAQGGLAVNIVEC